MNKVFFIIQALNGILPSALKNLFKFWYNVHYYSIPS